MQQLMGKENVGAGVECMRESCAYNEIKGIEMYRKNSMIEEHNSK